MQSGVVLTKGIAVLLVVLSLFLSQTVAFDETDLQYEDKKSFSVEIECQCCMRSYDRSCCEKCFESKSTVTPFFAKRSEPEYIESRVRRFTGCNCCYMSRFSNGFCCGVCNTASKRWAKRSGSDDLPEPETGSILSETRISDCSCCDVFKNKECCERCLKQIFI
ncbi:hypothetical protein SNE40_011919 [Patella caerulea]|uniref:Uncharacterized protein n=1 Tax=Patella caerulea TaxID=87958 RepID=A0AAN8JQF1_PATCE